MALAWQHVDKTYIVSFGGHDAIKQHKAVQYGAVNVCHMEWWSNEYLMLRMSSGSSLNLHCILNDVIHYTHSSHRRWKCWAANAASFILKLTFLRHSIPIVYYLYKCEEPIMYFHTG